jgi:hypothetical protein
MKMEIREKRLKAFFAMLSRFIVLGDPLLQVAGGSVSSQTGSD